MGFHELSLEEIKAQCVDSFPLSSTRKQILGGLGELVSELNASGVSGDLWIDGSFATRKVDPSDADVLFVCSGEAFDTGTNEYKKAINWLNSNLKTALMCESYVLFTYPEGHDLYTDYRWTEGFYIGRWGWSDGFEAKGIIVLKVSGEPS